MFAQIHINKEWGTKTGTPEYLEWSASAVVNDYDLVHVGNTVVPNEGANVLVTRYNNSGDIIWQEDYHTSGSNDDVGVAVTVDEQENIYVLGITDYDSTDHTDILLLKYNSNGTLQWSTSFNSTYELNDIGTDLVVDESSGNIYVCGSSESSAGNFDFMTVAFNSNGTPLWNTRYDYAGLMDVPIGINLLDGFVMVVGASAASASEWSLAALTYSFAGDTVNEVRQALPNMVYTRTKDFTKDYLGNLYITGSSSLDGITHHMHTVKFNNDFDGIFEDLKINLPGNSRGNAIVADSAGNNSIVGGFKTNSQGVREMYIVAYDDSGTELVSKTIPAEDPTAHAEIIDLLIVENGLYFIGQEKGQSGHQQGILGKLNSTGNIEWIRKVKEDEDVIPLSLEKGQNDNEVIAFLAEDGFSKEYNAVKYSLFPRKKIIETPSNGDAPYVKNNLVIRFDKSKLKVETVDNKNVEAGQLSLFVDSVFIVEMNSLTSFNWERASTYKIHRRLASTDSISISRQGDTIRMPDFWASFVVEIPDGFSEKVIADTLESIFGIHYAQLDYVYKTNAVPNDNFYLAGYQLGFHPNTVFPDADINVEGAWEIIKNSGNEIGGGHVKVGVYDHLIDWSHKEFGHSGLQVNSKAGKGWNYYTESSNISDAVDQSDSHGTMVAALMYSSHNPSFHWDYKNVLSTEDIELILEKTTQKNPNQYNNTDGYGLINAKEAVRQVTRPYTVRHNNYGLWNANIEHVGTTTPNTIYLWYAEEDLGIPNGTAFSYAEKYKPTWDVSFTPTAGKQIIDWWNVQSRSFGGQTAGGSLNSTTYSYQTNPIFIEDFNVDISTNQVSGIVDAYYWKFYRHDGSFVWLPQNPWTDLQFTYALHLFDNTLSVDEEIDEDKKIVIFPNPTNSDITIKNIPENADVKTIRIFDLSGRIVQHVNLSQSVSSITIPIERLVNGIYIVQIIGSSYQYSNKIIKK